ncbi:MAG TPA: SOS response-associated peptidase [Gammaproteobacteria bacterium]|jgi:putative SOS response-associated peptidase YedK|nr:SOS response-associated peptidase [Gammaproteobacteria bacterium]
MCGRYALYSSPEHLAKYFEASLQYRYGKSYNIAPTATIAVLIQLEQERLIVPMRWGLIPAWHKEGSKLTVLNNAKIETIESRPSFRSAFKRRRCMILADGFYEWDASLKPKQPHYFHRKDSHPVALAGIWERWVSGENAVDSCCIITEDANAIVSKVHDRMPAIIKPDDVNAWLDPELQETEQIKKLASKRGAYEGIVEYPVTSKMNRVAYDNAHCIERITK